MTDFKQIFNEEYDELLKNRENYLFFDSEYIEYSKQLKNRLKEALRILFKSIDEENFWENYDETFFLSVSDKSAVIYVHSDRKKEKEIKKKIREKYNNEIALNNACVEEDWKHTNIFEGEAIQAFNLNYHNAIRITFVA